MRHPKNKKRGRNKSSPQITSSPKKHRQSASVIDSQDDITEHTEHSDSGSDISLTLTRTSNMTDPTNQQMATNMATSTSDSQAGLLPPSTPQQYMNVPSQLAAGPPVIDHSMDPNMIQSPMNYNPQQMLNFGPPMSQPHHIQQMPSMQQMQQMPFCSRLSDDDVLRIAQQMKLVLHEEIKQLVDLHVTSVVEPIRQELEAVKLSCAKYEKDIDELKARNDELEQYSRRSCLRIAGILETRQEDVPNIVLNLANRVGADIRPEDIDRAHRVGRMRADSEQNENTDRARRSDIGREIIVKFCNYSARLKFLKGRATLRDEHAKIFINEDLTRTRMSLAYECRKLAKAKLIKKTWVFGGNIFVQDMSDRRIRMTCLSDLDKFKADTAGAEMETAHS